MSLFSKIVIGVIIYMMFLLVYLPANWLVSIAPLPNNMVISGAEGTLWQGKAALITIDQRQIERVSWTLSPWGLFVGQANIDFNVGNRATPVSGKGSLSWSLSGMSAKNIRLDLQDSFILAGARLPFKTQIDGDVSIMVEVLKQGKPWCEQLHGKLFVNHTNVKNQFGVYPLGNITLGLSCLDGQLQLATDETQNVLGLTGTAILGESNLVKVSAKIKPTDAQPKDLREALPFLGRQDTQGYYPINYQGVVPGL
ncbi:MAG: type II secretion system protein N [Shewanella psychromarinicola]|uniref:Type II secretion system protein N n=2 Tax=Gammaproteobacteria TaxID=1236 RepID=A0A3N4E652_9GAMM|nr:type II secretion system protein N [Shewanella psychromarinicola]AZG34456.1 type II secretion system protein N [Shewanella psychromarinicola]MCL1081988.1 type II secretion system protein N [Shewanella psychromarinicola]RPA32556.1 type II secretion system protein N [Shewanella psychromarinicola]